MNTPHEAGLKQSVLFTVGDGWGGGGGWGGEGGGGDLVRVEASHLQPPQTFQLSSEPAPSASKILSHSLLNITKMAYTAYFNWQSVLLTVTV